jgi:hypothetical protein
VNHQIFVRNSDDRNNGFVLRDAVGRGIGGRDAVDRGIVGPVKPVQTAICPWHFWICARIKNVFIVVNEMPFEHII